ncbi:MAG: methionine--tRNA ligase subunit beta [Candidatus Micrarchaeota archaeon]|nr:methionine--tRNA ligase subunit beta [Candidatus Micrarchaeota archaeon]
MAETITYEDFCKVEMRVGVVLTAEGVLGADKLIKMSVDLGSEKRQIVAGIRQYYAPEEMVGKIIVIVANLQPRVIRGIESQGMLLAADGGQVVVVASFEKEVAPGTPVR